ncbi:unnamed protein product [Penicillium roqueforti FM164]|uniref:Genomic scaffold, ProqFM164S03 n=1 Tax=Penicillium roqueforti (strain FM164) TaxID=1365484 RepID=W6QCH9_PENRF|nr:unnamed protein product [Penicillium roqueforti FM164]
MSWILPAMGTLGSRDRWKLPTCNNNCLSAVPGATNNSRKRYSVFHGAFRASKNTSHATELSV